MNTVTGTWDESLTLDVNRAFHVSWTPDPDIGTFLMGGAHWGGVSWDRENVNSTTLIKPDGSQEPGFSLKYNTEYEFDDIRELKFSFILYILFRDACAFEDLETITVVITGGKFTRITVSVYGLQGWIEDLQPLNIGRFHHACSSYMSGGSRVRH